MYIVINLNEPRTIVILTGETDDDTEPFLRRKKRKNIEVLDIADDFQTLALRKRKKEHSNQSLIKKLKLCGDRYQSNSATSLFDIQKHIKRN